MDINIKTIKEKLTMMQLAFDPNESAYSTISSIIKKTEDPKYNAIDLYQELSHFDDKTEMPQFLRDYLYSIMGRVNVLASQDKEIEEKIKEQEEQIENIIMELRIRGMYIETLKKEEYKNLESYKDRENYLANLKKQNENLEKTHKAITEEEKKLGDEYSEEFKKSEEDFTELKKVNEKAERNIKEINNPAIEQVLSIMDYYREHQNANSMSNIKIQKPENNPNIRIVEVGFKGTEVSEKEPMYRFIFTNAKEFDNDIVYRIIDGYHEAGPIEKTIDEPDTKELDIVGEDESRVEIENMDDLTDEEIKEYADSKGKTNERKQGMGPRVREMEGINSTAANGNIILLTISFLLLVLSAVLIIMIFTKS